MAAIIISLMCVIACLVYSPWLGLTGIVLGIIIILFALFDDYHTYHTIVQDHEVELDPKRKATEHGEHGKIVKLLETKVRLSYGWGSSPNGAHHPLIFPCPPPPHIPCLHVRAVPPL